MKKQIKLIKREMNFDEWKGLSFESKRDIWNQHWNPHKPEIGMTTKRAIVEQFSKELKTDFVQVGIGSFGWTAYMLFVIVNDSRIRIPKEYYDMPVNKGVILECLESNRAKVKFRYGETTEIDLNDKMKMK